MEPKRCVVALYSADPAALENFHSFDPESASVAYAITDCLIYIAADGSVQPSLATSWTRRTPVEWEFELRRGVEFHNGEPFDAHSVTATFRHHHEPTPTLVARGPLAPIVSVEALSDYVVRITTKFPDAMFLRRLYFFGQYPKRVLGESGRDALKDHPIGTGAYRFRHWHKGREIVLDRNPNHWARRATVDEIVLPIIRQKEWYERLCASEIDIALNIDSHDAVRLRDVSGMHVESAPAASSHWFLLADHGPLANVKVRRALNHAIQRRILVDIVEHGLGQPQRSVATAEQAGFDPSITPYAYDPELARRLLAEAGYADGFTLRGIVSETSSTLFAAIREFLSRVGVQLEGDVMPRAEWLRRVVGPHLMGGPPYDGDFALASVDNPIVDSLFHQFIFLFSHGPFSLIHNAEFDQQFLKAATSFDSSDPEGPRRALERYSVDNALVLFTVQHHVHYAARSGMRTALPRSGHFNATAWWELHARDSGPSEAPTRERSTPYRADADVSMLLEATSHLGTFYLKDKCRFNERGHERIWKNILASETRWRLQLQPMMRELVSQVEAKTNLANVLNSTERVGICGIAKDGRRLFVNAGYNQLVCDSERSLDDVFSRGKGNPTFAEVREAVDREGSWLGAIHLPQRGSSTNAPEAFHVTAAPATDHDGARFGYTLVFSDFSGAEERVRTQAIRTILDHVPYALFRIESAARILDGYSKSCDRMFVFEGDAILGHTLGEAFGLGEAAQCEIELLVSQVFDDFLPEEVSLGQIPSRIESRGRVYALDMAAIRNASDGVESILVSASDITEMVEARRAEERTRAALTVLRHKETFRDFANEFVRQLENSIAELGGEWELEVRRHLHTAKGVFGQFSLEELARSIHDIEGQERISITHLESIRDQFLRVLRDNAAIWDIRIGEGNLFHSVPRAQLDELRRAAERSRDVHELRAWVERFVGLAESRAARELLGPIEDACAQQAARRNKRVCLVVEGAEAPVPRELESVFPVLIHLLRNSIDHGIEVPEARGDKAAYGKLALRIDATSGFRIEVEDDGRGIDIERVVAKAIELGLIDAESASRLSREERLRLVFAATLSTADEISETSGRGVGLGAVEQAVRALGGSLQIATELGRGTRFRIEFPQRARRTCPGESPSVIPSA